MSSTESSTKVTETATVTNPLKIPNRGRSSVKGAITKRILAAIVPIVILMVTPIILLAVSLSMGEGLLGMSSVDGQQRLQLTPIVIGANGEDLPIYPGDHDIHHNERAAPQSRGTLYTAQADHEGVSDFYKAELSQRGWILQGERSHERSAGMDFEWMDTSNTTPFNLSLTVGMSWKAEDANTRTNVELTLQRWPVLTKVPMLNDAQQINVAYVTIPSYSSGYYYEIIERVTTYLTSASPSEVEDYYTALLPHHGWWLNEPPAPEWPQGITFSFQLGGGEVIAASGAVNITTKREETKVDSQTIVQLRIRGTGLDTAK